MKPIKNTEYGPMIGNVYMIGRGSPMTPGYHVRITKIAGYTIWYKYIDHPSTTIREDTFYRSKDQFFRQAIVE